LSCGPRRHPGREGSGNNEVSAVTTGVGNADSGRQSKKSLTELSETQGGNQGMNKKLVVLAVAGAFAMPFAASAKSTVKIYGKARVGYAHIDSGSGVNSGDGIFNPGGSAIGFKGTEDLGGGNAAWFQLEQTFPIGCGSKVDGSQHRYRPEGQLGAGWCGTVGYAV
jgi:hypothetical protein